MRKPFVLLGLIAFFPLCASALDRWIPIAGTVNNFRTDTRVFNPSTSKDIQVTAYFLPAGALDNNARIAAAGVTLVVGRRQMRALDDVVATVFNTTGIGAILLTSPDVFYATSRIYAVTSAGTLGQFCSADPPGVATPKGILLQLTSTAAFRTNIGAANPANADNNVTWNLYDKNGNLVKSKTKSLVAYEVMPPSNIESFFEISGADLSDAWVSFTATNPLFGYASVIDNSTTDPTFIAMQDDR